MAASDHKFRYLLQPGSNFQFVAKFRTWVFLSIFLMIASIATLFVNKAMRGDYMNWTIDFKGGSEIVYAFKDKPTSTKYVTVDSGKIRAALAAAGEDGFDVSDYNWDEDAKGTTAHVAGMIVRTPRYSAATAEQQAKGTAAINTKLASATLDKVAWSGDRVFLRSHAVIEEAAAKEALASAGLEMKPWTEEGNQYNQKDENTGEYSSVISVQGLDRQFEQVLEKALPDVDVVVKQAYGVGAKAGDKLRNDAAKSIIYAIFLIMLYLAFRFDIRYAPGAAFATIHDAVMVIGVFAVTWTEVSLTSVAAVLTVIGYSVNDTVIVFDRIRENQAKLKDKKLERIVDISINEMLVRTVLTSLTVFVVTLVMNLLGSGLIRNFAFAMNIGVIVGTYSSIFLAAPLFLWVSKKYYASAVSTTGRDARGAAVAAEP